MSQPTRNQRYYAANKEAMKARSKAYHQRNRQVCMEKMKKRREIDPVAYSKRNYKGNAKRRGLAYELSDEEFQRLYEGECFYCGQRPARGVDRFLNELGYTTTNCESCCKWCNWAKGNKDFEVMLEKCKAVVARHTQSTGTS